MGQDIKEEIRDETAKQTASAEHRSWEKRRLEREQVSEVEIEFRGRVGGCLTGAKAWMTVAGWAIEGCSG